MRLRDAVKLSKEVKSNNLNNLRMVESQQYLDGLLQIGSGIHKSVEAIGGQAELERDRATYLNKLKAKNAESLKQRMREDA